MLAIGLDTNVLVRYLTKDDEKQWSAAVAVIESGEQCFITNIVLCEVAWVLRGKPYQFQKDEIIKVMEAMLQSPTFEFENRSTVDRAIIRAKKGRADLADYPIGAISVNSNCREIVRSDRKLNGELGFRVLSIMRK